MDIKSFIIGFLLCLCLMLLTGFGGGSEVGRYQINNGKGSSWVIDTATGCSKHIKFGMSFKDLPASPY